jgi:ABC-type molybdenum transport system ATPase subunit/photorepair protein PhrA
MSTDPPDQSGSDNGAAPVVRFEHVSVVRDGTALLDDVSWSVGPEERWALLGPNGSGKTTLLRVVGFAGLWPTRGVVEILGARLGHGWTCASSGRRIAVVSASVSRSLRPGDPGPRRRADRAARRPGDLVGRVRPMTIGPRRT